jgi:hypothetical protein
MNARELSHLLKVVSRVLDLFGEKSLEEVLGEIDVHFQQPQVVPVQASVPVQVPVKAVKPEPIPVSLDVTRQMEQMNAEELQAFLRNEKMFKSKSSLLSLSKQLGVPASQRNNIPTLIHNLVKHFELRRLDQMIQQR